MSTPCISIVVPVYNSEKYLRQCLESIRTQTFKNFEALIVNNNTSDNSQAIIDDFANKDSRFISLFKKGGRAGGARNAALAQAQGEYVLFVDSDDWIAPTLCEHLYTTAKQYDLDMADSAGINISEDGIALKPRTISVAHPRRFLGTPSQMMALAQHNAKPWGKLVRRDILVKNDLWFPENQPHEDIAFISACFIFSKSFCQCFEPLYYYRQVSSSLSHSARNLFPQQLFATFIPIRNLLKAKQVYSQVAEDFEYQLVHMIIGEENSGSGRIKYMSMQDMKNFATQVGPFFDTLPKQMFSSRNRVFRLKWNVLKFSLRYHLYFLPKLLRPLYKLVALS